jgi:hypothetical protein
MTQADIDLQYASRGIVKLEDRVPRTYAREWKKVSWTSTGNLADGTAGRYGAAVAAGTSRGVADSPLFDLRPWLGREASSQDNANVQAVDTTSACDSYDPHLWFLVRNTSRSTRLASTTGIGNLRVWYIEMGHGSNPNEAIAVRARTEITDLFIAEVSDGWAYSIRPLGLRYWQAALVFEATTASLPSITVSQSMS